MKTEIEWADAELDEYRDEVATLKTEIMKLERLNQLVIEGAQLVEKELRSEIARCKACKYGDKFCPCQDGDSCHYEGENPMNPLYLQGFK